MKHIPVRLILSSLVMTSALVTGVVCPAHAQSLVPEMPSVEVNMGALDGLRSGAPDAPAASQAGAAQVASPFASSAPQVRQAPVNNPEVNLPSQSQPVAAAPAPASTGMILPPPPLPLSAIKPSSVALENTNVAAPAAKVAAPVAQEPVRQVPAQQPVQTTATKLPVFPAQKPVAQPRVPVEVVKPIAAPAQPLPKVQAAPVIAAQKPADSVKPVEAAKPAPLAVKQSAPVLPTMPAVTAPAAASQPVAKAPAPMLDFTKLGAPKPAASPAPVAAAAPKLTQTDSDVDAMLQSLDAANAAKKPSVAAPDAREFPALSPLPDVAPSVLPAPQGAKAASDVLVVAPAAEKPDPALKNLSDRVTNLFVKEPEKKGVLSDKTTVTGPLQNMPQKPAEVKPVAIAPAPEMPSNATAPKSGSVLDKLAQGAKNAPVIAPMDSGKAVVPAPTFPEPAAKPQVSAPKVATAEKAAPSPLTLPDLPAVPDSRGLAEKPKQLTLEEVNKKSPASSMRADAAPVDVEKLLPAVSQPAAVIPKQEPVVMKPAPVVAPVIVPEAKPVAVKPVAAASVIDNLLPPAKKVEPTPAMLSAAKPSSASVDALKPGAVAALPTLPVPASASSANATPAVDSLAAILPPPKDAVPEVKKVAEKSAKTSNVAAKEVPSSLPKLPTLDNPPALPSSLPSLSALTGDKKSSMDIAMDRDGVRAAEVAVIAPATKENTIPSLKNDTSLPKVTRGEAVSQNPSIKRSVDSDGIAREIVPSPQGLGSFGMGAEPETISAAVATPEKPAPVELAKTSIPATVGAVTPASVARSVSLPIEAGKPVLSVGFDKNKTDVELDMQNKIAGISEQAKKSDSVRILAYASGAEADKSAVRRISLSRALQVRAKLIDKGVDPNKITVQAVGNADGSNRDSADIILK